MKLVKSYNRGAKVKLLTKAFGINLGHVSDFNLEIHCPLQEVVAILDGLGVTGMEDNVTLTVFWDVGVSQMSLPVANPSGQWMKFLPFLLNCVQG